MCTLAVDLRINNHTSMEKHNFVTIANLSKEQLLYVIEMRRSSNNIPTGSY